MKSGKKNTGFVLTGVLMLLLIASLIGGAFLFSARSSFATVDQWRSRDECLLGVQSGLERRKYAVDQAFRADYNETHSWDSLDTLATFNGSTTYEKWTNYYSASPHVVTVRVDTTVGTVTKTVSNYTADVTLTYEASATHNGIKRKVREVIRYRYASAPSVGGGDSTVFDNVFFIDNVGFFSGVNCDFNGDVYANKDLDLQYSSIKVNGDRYSGAELLSHKDYKNDTWSKYDDQTYANRARPTEYTDYNRSNTNTYWPQGYNDQTITTYEWADIKEMPFVGPLSEYQAYALASGGAVSQAHFVSSDGTVSNSGQTVYAVWGDAAGENAGIGTNDTGVLILIGTEADPINISGIVVATGDIYIKGYFTGQGTLYAGRNIHVIGNLVAKDPPTWPKPDSNPQATATANKTKDFIGLCAKGSLFFGDYKALDTSLLKSPHTASHATDASDAALGYVSGYSGGIPYFDGDYTEVDGDGTAVRSDGSARHFYQPMISDTAMTALGIQSWIGWFDAVLYANHLISGDFDDNAVLNGGFVCRDESVKRHGNLVLNWDIRLGSKSFDGQSFSPWLPGMLPRQTTVYRTVKWTELAL
jgi:hypothetical protein